MFSERTTLQKLLLLKALSGGGQSLVERTALGNPLTFLTDLAKPLKSLLVPFLPVQSGSGDPSPQNIRPIVAWDGVKVGHGAKNLLNPAWLNFEGESVVNHGVTFTKNADGSITANGTSDGGAQVYFNVKGHFDGNFYICDDQLIGGDVDIYAYNNTLGQRVRKWDGTSQSDAVTASRKKAEVKLNSEENITVNVRVYSGRTVNNVTFKPMLVGGTETDFSYEQYVPITETDISFPSPVYGGELEAVSGKLLNDYEGHVTTWGAIKGDRYQSGYRQGIITFENEIPVSGQSGASATYQKCNIAKYQWDDFNGTSHFYTAIRNDKCEARVILPDDTPDETEIVVIAKLKTPQEITLTPEQITAIKGNNTIWSDANESMTAVYLVSSKYAEEHPVGGLGSGLGSGLLGSGTGDNPEDPIEDPIDDPEEEIPDNTEEGSEPDD